LITSQDSKGPLRTTSRVVLLIPVLLSAFTHLWNPTGFPSIYVDEGHYMRRAMQLMAGEGLQETPNPYNEYHAYDHPYFGQIFLAFMLKIAGYPYSADDSSSIESSSIEMLYLVPRVLMGLLAVLDTFLIYKIAECRYNRNVALIASVLFAVMPMTWLLRRILLDNILLPFILSSILFALYSGSNRNGKDRGGSEIVPALLSGIFLGLAIFTKVPSFTLIPLVSYIIFIANGRKLKWKTLGIWFAPVILIPAIWPIYSIKYDQFDEWIDGIGWQIQRIPATLFSPSESILEIDPISVILGTFGGIYLVRRKDFLFLLWAVPYIIFFIVIGYSQYIHIVLLFPLLCITAGIFVDVLSGKLNVILRNRTSPGTLKKARNVEPQRDISQYFNSDSVVIENGISSQVTRPGKTRDKDRFTLMISFLSNKLWSIMLFVIGTFGLISTGMLISTNVNDYHFEAYAAFVNYLPDKADSNEENGGEVTFIAARRWGVFFFWIPKYVLDKDIIFLEDRRTAIPQTEKMITIGGKLKDVNVEIVMDTSIIRTVEDISVLHDPTKYPFTNMRYNHMPDIEIRANYQKSSYS
jgi:hypothetical protein